MEVKWYVSNVGKCGIMWVWVFFFLCRSVQRGLRNNRSLVAFLVANLWKYTDFFI